MTPPGVDSEKYAALVIDANTGRTLHAVNAESPRYPASLTKMMTMYLLFEAMDSGRMNGATQIPVSAHAASQPPSKMRIRAGDSIDADTAVRALATKSANDVAAAVGEYLGGSEEQFVSTSRSGSPRAHGSSGRARGCARPGRGGTASCPRRSGERRRSSPRRASPARRASSPGAASRTPHRRPRAAGGTRWEPGIVALAAMRAASTGPRSWRARVTEPESSRRRGAGARRRQLWSKALSRARPARREPGSDASRDRSQTL